MTPMATQILKIVTERRNVSFAELSRSVEGFDGELGLILNDFNICLWPHLSQAAVDALEELRLAKAIYPKPTSVLVYLADGAVPNMPIARGRRRYKRPHWAPLVTPVAILSLSPPPPITRVLHRRHDATNTRKS
jgi:hypothetical protein